MAGQHIEREARYEQTRLTEPQRDELILKLWKRGWSQTKIAKQLRMTQPGVHYALKRLRGMPRRRPEADGSWEDEWYAPIP